MMDAAFEIGAAPAGLARGPLAFERALASPDISFICEVKKASPSKGVLDAVFDYPGIAAAYEAAGAAALSVLTEPLYFQGSPVYLKEIASLVSLPVLRKDFIIDPYQIYEAKTLGAAAILLICSVLGQDELRAFHTLAHSLGLSVLVEAHDETEVARALAIGARIIGVNNRDLKDFSVDLNNSLRLRECVPDEVLFVSESGIHTAEDVKRLRDAGVDAILVGEAMMRAENKKAYLNALRGEA
jgi:indole-3-glycerol phosphate synthase